MSVFKIWSVNRRLLCLVFFFSIIIANVDLQAWEQTIIFSPQETDTHTEETMQALSLKYYYESKQRPTSEDMSDRDKYSIGNELSIYRLPPKVFINITTEEKKVLRYEVQLQAGHHTLYWYPHLIGKILSVTISADDSLLSLHDLFFSLQMRPAEFEEVEDYKIFTSSLEDMFEWKALDAREEAQDFYIFRWQSYPDVLVLAFTSRQVQARYLKRIAFFAEKTDTRGRVVYLSEIADRYGWGAHDYKITDMAEFYNKSIEKARQDGVRPFLNEQELHLQDILVGLNMINRNKEASVAEFTKNDDDGENNKSSSTEGATEFIYTVPLSELDSSLVSYARSDRPDLQRILLFHELLHTIYFRDEAVRSKLNEVWDKLSKTSKEIWKAFMRRNGYDPHFDYLMKNELFAYLLQRPIQDLEWYIPSRILAEAIPQLRTTVTEKAQKEFTKMLIQTAEELSSYLKETYFLQDGNVQYVRLLKN